MSRIDLDVPFLEKDEAKKRGARWDPEKKVWYVPERQDPSLFHKWLPQVSRDVEMNFRAPSYFIAESSKKCWECEKVTHVYSFLLPAGHEVLGSQEEKEGEDPFQWRTIEEPTILHYVEHLPDSVITQIQIFTKNYRKNLRNKLKNLYWGNHCEHCKIQQDDWDIHHEPDGAFFPISKETASKITLHFVNQTFTAHAHGGSRDILYFCTEEPEPLYAAGLIDYMQKGPSSFPHASPSESAQKVD